MKKRLLIMCPNPNDSTSFWRGAGPLSHLEKNFTYDQWEMVLYKNKEIAWSDLIYFDAVFFQRPHSDAHIKMLRLSKDLGLKIWADYDDDLSSIPYSNPAFKHYESIDIQKNLSWIAANVDVISVSTNALKSKYEPLNKNTKLIPNAWNETFSTKRGVNNSTAKIILWRGSATHDQDLDHYLPEMAKVAAEHPDWKWVFVGHAYWKVTQLIPKHLIVPPFDVPAFLKFMGQISASIGIVPLAPHPFNLSKSNIAWQEASYSGACTIAPNWEEWRRPGVMSYSSKETFYSKLKSAIAMTPHERKSAADSSWAHIDSYESLRHVNIERVKILEEISNEL